MKSIWLRIRFADGLMGSLFTLAGCCGKEIPNKIVKTCICVVQPSQTASEIIIDHMPEGGSVHSYFAV